MITIFSTCKPFVEEFEIIQVNAITSWKKLHKDIEIILLGDETGVSQICKKLGLKHIPEIKRSDLGTPYINDMFEKAKSRSRYDVLCYINADIIMLPGIIEVIDFISHRLDRFLLVGRRWNIDIKERIDFSDDNWYYKLKQYVIENGKLSPVDTDYFIFSKDLYMNIPAFIIGRSRWESWLVGAARLRTLNVFDATDTIFAIHQNHSYRHNPQWSSGIRKGVEAQYNWQLSNKFRLHIKMGGVRKIFFKLKKKNNHIEISPNWQGYVRSVFAYIKGILPK